MHTLSINDIFSIQTDEEFQDIALRIFRFQAENSHVYREYLFHLGINVSAINNITQIPFLPIEFFKTHQILCADKPIEKAFFSSGTTGQQRSNHFVSDISIYEKSFMEGFKLFYGNPEDYCIVALLPSYMENESSSLVYMADYLINKSKNEYSGFYLNALDELPLKLKKLESLGQTTILLGVSYALLDLVEQFPVKLSHAIIMETGGMKGRRKELTKKELHQVLCSGFGVGSIHSEYGMTELLSQAYAKADGKFFTPPWMKILIRDTYDPFTFLEPGKSGGINIIDLANIYSCSFIETKDLGKINPDGSFEVLGRFDYSDIRGCNLLVAE